MALYNILSPGCCFPRRARPRSQRLATALATVCVVGFAGGCERSEGIRHYRVPKEHVLAEINGPQADEAADSAAPDYRMLAAIVPRGEQAWFFRLMGPAERVAGASDNFRALVKSVRFAADDAPPEWTLPEGWRQKPASGMRYATIEAGAADQALDLSVTVLPRNEPNFDVYTLSNVNRWRGQLGLPPLAMARLHDGVEELELDGAAATLVDLVGHKPKDGMSRAPFAAGQMPPEAPAIAASGQRADQTPDAPPLTYDVPSGWTETSAGGLRKAAFAIADGDKQAEVTVIALSAAGGALLPNVNRWREQINLPAINDQELAADLKKLAVGALAADYIELVGPEKTILGAILEDDGRTWFFKMTGDGALVRREKPNFETFVQSVRFGPPDK